MKSRHVIGSAKHSMVWANLNKSKFFLSLDFYYQSIKFGSERGGFQLIQILVLLGMYFDAVGVFVTSQKLLFRLALAILWQ